MSRALLSLPGREALFLRVLGQFAEQYGAGFPALGAALAAGDWPQAQQLLHGLRGACGAIGASDLLDQARTLELALASHAACEAGNTGEPARPDADLAAAAGPAAPQRLLRINAALLQQSLHRLVDAINAHRQQQAGP